MSNREKLKQCFRDSFALTPGTDIEKMTYAGATVWDSVGHMRLVASIETAFNIMFTTDQILDMSSYTKACEILNQHGIALTA